MRNIIIILFLFAGNCYGGMLPRSVWYVQPVTGEYGAENGTTLATAFDGFADIDWNAIQPNDYLICQGNFLETLTIGKSGTANKPITIIGRACSINASGLISGISIIDYGYITIRDIYIENATTNNIYIGGTSTNIIINRAYAQRSGNQAFQNEGTSSAKYIGVQGNYCTDDGFSMHDNCNDTILGGSFYGNVQGVNSVGTSNLYMSNSYVHNSTTYGLWLTQSNYYHIINSIIYNNNTNITLENLSEILLENSTVNTATDYNIYAKDLSKSTINNCTITSATTSNIIAIDSSDLTINETSIINSTARAILVTSTRDTSCRIILNKCIIGDYMYLDECYFEMNYCKITSTDNQHIIDSYNQSQLSINYSIFTTIPNTKSAITARAGALANVRNSVMYGIGTKQGSGIVCLGTANSTNNIFSNCATGFNRAGGTATSTNDCFYSNTANTAGTITISNQITTNPNFVIAGTDFSLAVGSSCIDAGANLGEVYQLGLKNNSIWTNSINLLNQNNYENWEIGAYVYEP